MYFGSRILPVHRSNASAGFRGRITLELSFDSPETARQRLLNCGGGIEVLAPKALRFSILDYTPANRQPVFKFRPLTSVSYWLLFRLNLRMMDEKLLLQRARKFDLQALAEIYDMYSSCLYAYALRILGEAFLAEDCVAETFRRLLNALRDGKGPQQDLKPYLYRIAHNWINDIYRRQPIPPLSLEDIQLPAVSDGVEAEVSHRIQQEQARAALLRLTADQRQVIMLKFIEGWENDEIAEALQKPVGAVKSLQHRALDSLRRIIGNEEVRKYGTIIPTD
jgi:RNA polymerase sigma-70 factor (ECF subfamily)